jgi:hypothetical protein
VGVTKQKMCVGLLLAAEEFCISLSVKREETGVEE